MDYLFRIWFIFFLGYLVIRLYEPLPNRKWLVIEIKFVREFSSLVLKITIFLTCYDFSCGFILDLSLTMFLIYYECGVYPNLLYLCFLYFKIDNVSMTLFLHDFEAELTPSLEKYPYACSVLIFYCEVRIIQWRE